MGAGKSHLNEKFVQEIWKNQSFEKELITKNGQQITILDSGIENKEVGGPDFKNAKIKVGNITYTGDIEIDSSYSDWKTHGHHLNKKYNRLILHLTLMGENDHPYVYTEDGRKVQSISLSDLLDESLRSELHNAIITERAARQSRMSCIDTNKIVMEKEKLDFLYELGMDRFKHKCNRIIDRLKEIIYEKELRTKEPIIGYDPVDILENRAFSSGDFSDHEIWEQVLYELIFEALGYSKNKEQMLRLAKTVDLSLVKKLRKKKNSKIYLESLYFTVAGLVPNTFQFKDDETSEYVRRLRETWNEIQPLFDNKLMKYSSWHFNKLRPQNFPTLRIAGGLRIVLRIIDDNIIGRMISDFKNISDMKNLVSALRALVIIKGEGYWHDHYIFDGKTAIGINYFVGVSRVDELMINVLFPAFSLYFEIFNKKDIARKVQRLYLNYVQVTDNTLVSEVSENLALRDAWKRSVLYQGMIELYRSYCSRDRCLECKIGKAAFG